MGLIAELWCGNIHPMEKEERGCEKEAEKYLMAEEKLLKALNAEQRVLFESFMSERAEFTAAAEQESFFEGFRLGAGLIMEVVSGQAKGK